MTAASIPQIARKVVLAQDLVSNGNRNIVENKKLDVRHRRVHFI